MHQFTSKKEKVNGKTVKQKEQKNQTSSDLNHLQACGGYCWHRNKEIYRQNLFSSHGIVRDRQIILRKISR